MIERRKFLLGLGAIAPAVILTPGLLMPVKGFVMPASIGSYVQKYTVLMTAERYIWSPQGWKNLDTGALAREGVILADADRTKPYFRFLPGEMKEWAA